MDFLLLILCLAGFDQYTLSVKLQPELRATWFRQTISRPEGQIVAYLWIPPQLFHLLKLRSSRGESHARSSKWWAAASHAASWRCSCMLDGTENESEKCMRAFSFLIHRSNYTAIFPPPPRTKWKTNQEVRPSYECTWQTSVTNHRRLDGVPEDMLDWISIKLAVGTFDVNRCIGATAKKKSSIRRGARQCGTASGGNSPQQQKYTKNIFLLSAVIKLRAALLSGVLQEANAESHQKRRKNSVWSRPRGHSAAATLERTDRSASVWRRPLY